MKILIEQFSQEKENYYLQKIDIGNLGTKQIVVSDDVSLYYVDIKDGNVEAVSQPDGDKQFSIDDINAQLETGATLGAAITGEHNPQKNIKKAIKESVRRYLLS